jgi:hypothetical protein
MFHLCHVDPVIVLVRADLFDPDNSFLEIEIATTNRYALPFTLKTMRSAVTMLALA